MRKLTRTIRILHNLIKEFPMYFKNYLKYEIYALKMCIFMNFFKSLITLCDSSAFYYIKFKNCDNVLHFIILGKCTLMFFTIESYLNYFCGMMMLKYNFS